MRRRKYCAATCSFAAMEWAFAHLSLSKKVPPSTRCKKVAVCPRPQNACRNDHKNRCTIPRAVPRRAEPAFAQH
jgi:hypothetical protein